MRESTVSRKTEETAIELTFHLDGTGETSIDTGVGFMNHMLTLFAKHGRFDLSVQCKGDLEVDQHHSIEDIGIALGQTFYKNIGDKRGITRYGEFTMPMDEALATVNIDISGRPFLVYNVEGLKDKVGAFDTELVEEFLIAFTSHARVTLHVNVHYGKNTHHMIEAIFKALGRALNQASCMDPLQTGIPSTKGVLE
ncbi:MAG TPA: imidazoleglycerol-phosphate dehydratase HisB [Savagea sp.]